MVQQLHAVSLDAHPGHLKHIIADQTDEDHLGQLGWDQEKAELSAGAIPPGWRYTGLHIFLLIPLNYGMPDGYFRVFRANCLKHFVRVVKGRVNIEALGVILIIACLGINA